jgi:hypothetical protein
MPSFYRSSPHHLETFVAITFALRSIPIGSICFSLAHDTNIFPHIEIIPCICTPPDTVSNPNHFVTTNWEPLYCTVCSFHTAPYSGGRMSHTYTYTKQVSSISFAESPFKFDKTCSDTVLLLTRNVIKCSA